MTFILFDPTKSIIFVCLKIGRKGAIMLLSENLTSWYDNNFVIDRLYGIKSDKIIKSTKRDKGQYVTERLFYIKSGKTYFMPEDSSAETIIASAGDIVYLPPDIVYMSEWEKPEEGRTISIHFLLKCDNEQIQLSDSLCVIAHDRHELYLKLFDNYITNFEGGRLGYKIKCQSIFLDILYLLVLSLTSISYKKSVPNVGAGILYIENNYLNEFDVNELAEICSLCPSSFRKYFHAAVGMSPIEYKNYLKMRKASELLQTGKYNITETASQVNIDDIYYFSKMFKKYFGISPKEFRLPFIV